MRTIWVAGCAFLCSEFDHGGCCLDSIEETFELELGGCDCKLRPHIYITHLFITNLKPYQHYCSSIVTGCIICGERDGRYSTLFKVEQKLSLNSNWSCEYTNSSLTSSHHYYYFSCYPWSSVADMQLAWKKTTIEKGG